MDSYTAVIWCGKRLDHRGVHGEHGVEEVCARRMRCASETRRNRAPSPVEAPGPADLDDFQVGLVVTVQKLVGDLAGGRLVGQLQRFGAEPLHADDRGDALGQNAAYRSVGLEIFELHAVPTIVIAPHPFVRVARGPP